MDRAAEHPSRRAQERAPQDEVACAYLASGNALRPGPRRFGLRLEARDLVLLGERLGDVVEAVEQAVLAMRIDVELDRAAVGAADFLALEVDGEPRIGAALGIVDQLFQALRSDP